MEFIQSRKQTTWGWPAVVNFLLGGMASGFYILGIFVAILQDGIASVSQPAAYKLIAPVLAGLGLAALSIEAGKPLRSIHLLKHLDRSWMSRETLAGIIFIPPAMLDWLFPHPVLWGLAIVGAVGFMVSQGFILYRARAIPAWNMPLMPLFFVTSGFVTGSGLLLFSMLLNDPALTPIIISLICVVLNLIAWLLYLRWSGDPAFQKATRALRRPKSLVLTVGGGQLLPIVLLLLVVLWDSAMSSGFQNSIMALVGGAIVIGGLAQKSGIIISAGYLRAIVLGDSGNIPNLGQTLPIVSAVIRQND